jgi:uncharacterized protein
MGTESFTVLIRKEAERFFNGVPGSHDWSHTERVTACALRIAQKEGGDPEIVELAALLHDIGRKEEDVSNGEVCHAEQGAIIARDILSRHGYDRERTESVVNCIRTHRFRSGEQPESLEAKIIYDADKLDCIGAVGIGRAFLFAGEVGATLHNSHVDISQTQPYSREDTAYREYTVKLKHVKDRMLTEEGKKIAVDRHAYMTAYFKRLDRETAGKE